jgi:hypothetical protein
MGKNRHTKKKQSKKTQPKKTRALLSVGSFPSLREAGLVERGAFAAFPIRVPTEGAGKVLGSTYARATRRAASRGGLGTGEEQGYWMVVQRLWSAEACPPRGHPAFSPAVDTGRRWAQRGWLSGLLGTGQHGAHWVKAEARFRIPKGAGRPSTGRVEKSRKAGPVRTTFSPATP